MLIELEPAKRRRRIPKGAKARDLGERAPAVAARHLGVEAVERASIGTGGAASVLLALGADSIVDLVVELDQEGRRLDRLFGANKCRLAHVEELGFGGRRRLERAHHRVEGAVLAPCLGDLAQRLETPFRRSTAAGRELGVTEDGFPSRWPAFERGLEGVARALDRSVLRQIARFVDGTRVEQRHERRRVLDPSALFQKMFRRTRVTLREPSRRHERALGIGRSVGTKRDFFDARRRRRGRLARFRSVGVERRAVVGEETKRDARALPVATDAGHDAHASLLDRRGGPSLDAPSTELVAAGERELSTHDERRGRGTLENDADRLSARNFDVDHHGAKSVEHARRQECDVATIGGNDDGRDVLHERSDAAVARGQGLRGLLERSLEGDRGDRSPIDGPDDGGGARAPSAPPPSLCERRVAVVQSKLERRLADGATGKGSGERAVFVGACEAVGHHFGRARMTVGDRVAAADSIEARRAPRHQRIDRCEHGLDGVGCRGVREGAIEQGEVSLERRVGAARLLELDGASEGRDNVDGGVSSPELRLSSTARGHRREREHQKHGNPPHHEGVPPFFAV